MKEKKMSIHIESVNWNYYYFKLHTYEWERIVDDIKNRERIISIYYWDKRYYLNLDNIVKIEIKYLDN